MHVGSVPRFPASQCAAAEQGIGSKTYSRPLLILLSLRTGSTGLLRLSPPGGHRSPRPQAPDRWTRWHQAGRDSLRPPPTVRSPDSGRSHGARAASHDFLRGQVDRNRDLNGIQRVGSVHHFTEGINGLQERLSVEPEGLHALTRLGVDPQLLDGALVPQDCISCTSLIAPGSAGPSVVACNTIIKWAMSGSIWTCWMRKTRLRSTPRPRTCLSIRTLESMTLMTYGPATRCSTRPSLQRTGSCAPRSGAGCLWSRWLPRAAVTRTDAVRSAAMRRRTGLPPSTGETDDEHAHDT